MVVRLILFCRSGCFLLLSVVRLGRLLLFLLGVIFSVVLSSFSGYTILCSWKSISFLCLPCFLTVVLWIKYFSPFSCPTFVVVLAARRLHDAVSSQNWDMNQSCAPVDTACPSLVALVTRPPLSALTVLGPTDSTDSRLSVRFA